ncbi:MAG: methyltransferase domain-containing protein [Pseudomonadota bacterium]|nr:methyltransferase domain-containing protein [Pseudomonadota bacterium]
MAATVRQVEPEWLDELPADDPRAMRSRRDLQRVNALMDNAGIVAGELRRAAPFGLAALAEIGAGDGAFALRVARALAPVGRGAQMTLLDRQAIVAPATTAGLGRAGWTVHAECGDVFDWLRGIPPGRFDAIVANLFLHHFDGPRLAELLALIAARARCFIACEPRRSRVALAGSRLLGLVGCNDVTRHDAVASVRAGFAGAELSVLWPNADGWILEERRRGLFSHCFVARKP